MMKPYTALMIVLGILALVACTASHSGESETKTDTSRISPRQIKNIAGIEWHLTKMITDNKTIALINDTQTTFSCDEDGKVAGVASLNRYFGNFTIKDDGQILWSKAFGMTRMAGPPELMEQEAKFMQALPQTSHMYLKASKLILASRDQSTVLEFLQVDE